MAVLELHRVRADKDESAAAEESVEQAAHAPPAASADGALLRLDAGAQAVGGGVLAAVPHDAPRHRLLG